MIDGDIYRKGGLHKVAVVDDDEDICRMLRDLLDRSGVFACAGTFATGVDGLEGIPRLEVEVVLLDQRLPGSTGLECLGMFKARLPDLRIILVTAVLDDSVFDEALRRGVDDVLIKPFLPAQCFTMLKSVLRSAGRVGEQIPAVDILTASPPKPAPDFSKIHGSTLNDRETKVLGAAAAGLYYKEIAFKTGWSHSVVHNVLHSAYKKLGAANRTEALNKWESFRRLSVS